MSSTFKEIVIRRIEFNKEEYNNSSFNTRPIVREVSSKTLYDKLFVEGMLSIEFDSNYTRAMLKLKRAKRVI